MVSLDYMMRILNVVSACTSTPVHFYDTFMQMMLCTLAHIGVIVVQFPKHCLLCPAKAIPQSYACSANFAM